MLIEIKNFGPIHKFTFDVTKDLHMIYGKNSIGKSYAIYCVYILLKKLSERQSRSFLFFGNETSLVQDKLLQISERISVKSNQKKGFKVDVREDFTEILATYFNDTFSAELTESFGNTFASLGELKNSFSNKKPEIKIFNNGISLCLCFDKSNSIIAKEIQFDIALEVLRNKRSKKQSFFFNGLNILDFNENREESNMKYLVGYLLSTIIGETTKEINQIYFLPSSRSGLYLALSSFSPIIAELSKFRFQLKKKIELPSISEPISDYFIPLANISSKKISKQFTSIIAQLEQDILQGSVSVDNENKRILFQPKNSLLKLDLSATSSMVSEIAPIVTYLKHIININIDERDRRRTAVAFFEDTLTNINNSKSIIFIEEPEAHLHPEVQVRLMEIFAELTKFNIKVVITSHSNYMFNKLVNLLLAKEISYDKVSVRHMVMTSLGSIVKDDMQATEHGIEDYNFSETSEKLYEERMEIVEN